MFARLLAVFVCGWALATAGWAQAQAPRIVSPLHGVDRALPAEAAWERHEQSGRPLPPVEARSARGISKLPPTAKHVI